MPGALSARHVHAVIAATVRVVRKKIISCKIDFSGMGCRGAVCHCIAPAVDINVFFNGVLTNIDATSLNEIVVFVLDSRRLFQPARFAVTCAWSRAEGRALV